MSERRTTLSERLFGLFLAALPRDFRDRFAEDMRELFRDELRAARARAGVMGIVRLWLRAAPSLARVALVERRDARRDRRVRAAGAAARRMGRDGMIETWIGDLRLAGRMLRKSPIFTTVAVLCVAIGCGAVTTIFSAMNAVLLRPLPGAADGDRLVSIDRRTPDASEGVSASYDYYEHLRDRSRTLDGVAAWSKVDLSIAVDGSGTAVYGNIVSGNYFSVLGVRPALGRFFAPGEDRTPLADPVIVVSHAFWRTRLGADGHAVGRTVGVNGHPYTVIGVAPPGFRGAVTPIDTNAWVLLSMQQQLRPGRDLSGAPWLHLFGRLAAGATRAAARQELTTLTASYVASAIEPAGYSRYASVRLFDLNGLPEDASRAAGGFMGLLLGAATLVLLIASVNVASMLSARAAGRRRELAVRAALGAGRVRLVGQLLTESLLLFLLGAAGGVALAFAGTRALEQIPVLAEVPLSMALTPDLRVLAFALLVSLITGVIFGLAPALQGARSDITARLRADSAGGGTRPTVMGRMLIVGQLALSLLLLVAAGLFLRALDRGHRVEPGFDLSDVATASLNAESWGYDEARARAFYRTLRDRLAALPGVAAVSYTGVLPLTWGGTGSTIQAGEGSDGGARIPIGLVNVDVDYFSTLRLPLLQGRGFGPGDDSDAPNVAVINETLARRLSPDGNALGTTFGFRGGRVAIVGIARDAKYSNLAEDTPPFAYFPLAQAWQPNQILVVRTAGDPNRLGPGIHETIRSLDPALPPPSLITLEQAAGIVLLPQRVAVMVTGALGTVGLLLAAVGLYGTIAYSTTRRTREIGVRMALGAQRSHVLRLIVGDGMRLAGSAVAIGLLLAVLATRFMSSFLFGLSPTDGLTFAAMSMVFATVTFVAAYLPARRAAASDPMAALRAE